MLTFLAFGALIVLFYLLGKSADLVVFSLRSLGRELDIRLSFLGIVLGIFTSAPEFAIGVHSVVRGIQGVSVGNLLGGTIVILGLVLGMSIVLNRRIASDGHLPLPLIVAYLFLPFALGADGTFGMVDGVVLAVTYFAVLYLLYRQDSAEERISLEIINKRHALRHIFFIGPGLVLLVVLSDLIVRLTSFLVSGFDVSLFFIGLMVYSLGTNLPEIIVTVRAWRNGARELSYTNALGSAMANGLGIGVLSFLAPLTIDTGEAYYALILVAAALLASMTLFQWTGRQLVRGEGMILIMLYVVFVVSQLLLAV